MSAGDEEEKKSSSGFTKLENLMAEFRWPKKGDRLLREEGDLPQNVTFAEHVVDRDVLIWDGYFKAGAMLVDQCERGDNLDRHTLVYPILYCYRHGLELAMKRIIGQYSRFAHFMPTDYMHHDLWKLWENCKTVILELGSDGKDKALRAVEKVVKEFHHLDQGSFSFRYSTDKKGMVIPLPNVPIDLSNIKNVMEGVAHFFEGVDAQLDQHAYIVQEQEMDI